MREMNEHTRNAINEFFTPEFTSADDAGFQCFLMATMVFTAVQNMFGNEGLVEFIQNILEEMDDQAEGGKAYMNTSLKIKSLH